MYTSFISCTSLTVIESNQDLSERNFSTLGNLSVQPVLNLSLSMISAALIYKEILYKINNKYSINNIILHLIIHQSIALSHTPQ